MAKYTKHIPPIEETITQDGPIIKELQKPQLMFVSKQNYGVRKLWKRLNNSK